MPTEWNSMWKSTEVPDLSKELIFSSIPVKLSKVSSTNHYLTIIAWKPRWEEQLTQNCEIQQYCCLKPFCMGWLVRQQSLTEKWYTSSAGVRGLTSTQTFPKSCQYRVHHLESAPLGTHDLLYYNGKGREGWELHTNFLTLLPLFPQSIGQWEMWGSKWRFNTH